VNLENESTEALIRALRDENHQLRTKCMLATQAFEENVELRTQRDAWERRANGMKLGNEKLDREVHDLTAEIAALRNDKARLDWCDEHQAEISSVWEGEDRWSISKFIAPQFVTVGEGDNIRQAIDAAIQEGK
jgi:hypothetical protein